MLTIRFDQLGLRAGDRVLDVGAGFGRHVYECARRGAEVVALDYAADEVVQTRATLGAMVVAGEIPGDRMAAALRGDATRLPFADDSFDVVIASHVLHGLRAPERRRVYAEMNRVARHLVIVHDYNKNRATLTDLVEWLEGGDYFNVIQRAQHEMEEVFCDVRAIDVALRAAWYICSPAK